VWRGREPPPHFCSVGPVGVRLGLPWLHSALGLVVAGLYSAWEIIKNSAEVLCDAAVLEPQAIEPLVNGIPGVVDCHQVRSRGRADAVYVALHVLVDPSMTVEAAHALSHMVEGRLKGHLPGVVDVLVHVEPIADGVER